VGVGSKHEGKVLLSGLRVSELVAHF
jgi:hypothetical protein